MPLADPPAAATTQLVLSFIEAFYNDKDFERAGELLSEDFVNHHPGVGVGRQRTIDTFRRWVAEPQPGFSLVVRRTVAEGDLVVTHAHARPAPEADGAVVVDIWRVEGGRLVEKWDVGQAPPDGSSIEEMLGGG